MPRSKPIYVDAAARNRDDRPPFAPLPRHPLSGYEARAAARWLRCWSRRKPAAPLSPIVDLRLRGIMKGHRPLGYRFFTETADYVMRRKQEARQRTEVTLQFRLGGGLSLIRPQ
jgi:hypothetical protein